MAAKVNPVKINSKNCSRIEILAWLNDTLQENVREIEDLCSGVAYCQIMDSLFPGSVSMKRVEFCTNFRHEYKRNFKILQASFKKLHVDKIIPIERLINKGYKDNFEFLQWFKKFYDANCDGKECNVIAARDSVPMRSDSDNVQSTTCSKPIVDKMNCTLLDTTSPTSKIARLSAKAPLNPAAASSSNTVSFANNTGAIKKNQQIATTLDSTKSLSPTCKTIKLQSQQKFAEMKQPRLEKLSPEMLNLHLSSPGTSSVSRKSSPWPSKTKTGSGNKNSSASSTNLDAAEMSSVENFTLKRQVEYLKNKVLNMVSFIGDLEKERDFYFSKLRNIEFLCQGTEENGSQSMIQNVKYVLYATDENFETLNDNQNDEDEE